MRFSTLIKHPADWMTGEGADNAIVLTSRIRLARNLAGVPFPGWAKKFQRAETLEQMRKMPALATTPVIFMTAYTPDPTLQIWCKQVDIDVIPKPIDPLALSDQILGLLEKMRSQCA